MARRVHRDRHHLMSEESEPAERCPPVIFIARRKPHEILLLVLALLSGVSLLAGPAEPDSMRQELPPFVPTAWAVVLLVSAILGLGGILWRGNPIRGMLIERGALRMQAGMVLIYGAVLISYAGWSAVISGGAALAWCLANLWECRLITQDLRHILKASR